MPPMMRLVPLELCQYHPRWACGLILPPGSGYGLTLPPPSNIIAHFMKNYEFGSHRLQGCPLVIKKVNHLKHNLLKCYEENST